MDQTVCDLWTTEGVGAQGRCFACDIFSVSLVAVKRVQDLESDNVIRLRTKANNPWKGKKKKRENEPGLIDVEKALNHLETSWKSSNSLYETSHFLCSSKKSQTEAEHFRNLEEKISNNMISVDEICNMLEERKTLLSQKELEDLKLIRQLEQRITTIWQAIIEDHMERMEQECDEDEDLSNLSSSESSDMDCSDNEEGNGSRGHWVKQEDCLEDFGYDSLPLPPKSLPPMLPQDIWNSCKFDSYRPVPQTPASPSTDGPDFTLNKNELKDILLNESVADMKVAVVWVSGKENSFLLSFIENYLENAENGSNEFIDDKIMNNFLSVSETTENKLRKKLFILKDANKSEIAVLVINSKFVSPMSILLSSIQILHTSERQIHADLENLAAMVTKACFVKKNSRKEVCQEIDKVSNEVTDMWNHCRKRKEDIVYNLHLVVQSDTETMLQGALKSLFKHLEPKKVDGESITCKGLFSLFQKFSSSFKMQRGCQENSKFKVTFSSKYKEPNLSKVGLQEHENRLQKMLENFDRNELWKSHKNNFAEQRRRRDLEIEELESEKVRMQEIHRMNETANQSQ